MMKLSANELFEIILKHTHADEECNDGEVDWEAVAIELSQYFYDPGAPWETKANP